MYGIVPVIEKDISSSAWAVWAALCTFAHWEKKRVHGTPIRSVPGTCFPGKKALAERAHMSERTVRSALIELEAARLIEIRHRDGESSQYVLFPFANAPLAGQQDREPRQPQNEAEGSAKAEFFAFMRSLSPAP